MQAGRLRHRIAIDRRDETRDADGDETGVVWTEIATNLPAEIAPLSARDMMLAASEQSETTARITIRWMPGLRGSMRARRLDDGRVYDISAPIEDNRSGREWITLNATEGVNDG